MITVKSSGWLQKGINPCRINALDYHIVFIEDLQINLYKLSQKQLLQIPVNYMELERPTLFINPFASGTTITPARTSCMMLPGMEPNG